MNRNLWSIIALYLDYNACERVSFVSSRLHQIMNNDLFWRLRFEQDYYSPHEAPTISWKEACYRSQLKLFRVTASQTPIPLLVHYITNNVIIDIFGHSYFITHDETIHDLTNLCIGQIRQCIHSVQHPEVFHITYINDRRELYNLAVGDTTHNNTLIKTHVSTAAYAHESAMVIVDEDQNITIFASDYVNSYSVVIDDIHRKAFWRQVNISLPSPVVSLVMSGSPNQHIGIVTEDGKCYLLKTQLFMKDREVVRSVEEVDKASYLFHLDCAIFAVVGRQVMVISSYQDRKKSLGCIVDHIEDINGCPMITYQNKVYSLDSLARILSGPNHYHYYLAK